MDSAGPGGSEGEHLGAPGPSQCGTGTGRAGPGASCALVQNAAESKNSKFTPGFSHHCEVTFVNILREG